LAPAPAAKIAGVRSREKAEIAWARIGAPLREGEGIRVGALGVTRIGKTTGIRSMLGFLKARWNVILVDDWKYREPQYDHDQRIARAELVFEDPPEQYPAVILVRGHERRLIEESAAAAMKLGYADVPTCLVADELSRATTDGGREWIAPSVRQILLEGGGNGVSLIWTTQLPQRTPVAAFDQSVLVLFNPGRKALSYLEDTKVIGSEEAKILPTLQRGEFIVSQADADWDGVVYEVPQVRERALPPVEAPELVEP
jgi:hypothetical protein